MLFESERHEVLSTSRWNSSLVETEINTIIEDIERSLLPNACWPTHPLDAEGYSDAGPKWAAYAGAAGAIHALQILKHYGYLRKDYSHLLGTVHSSFLNSPDVSVQPGLQIGEIGILVPRLLTEPKNHQLSQYLLECMESTLDLPFYEITAGQTGMMHAALALYRKTSEDRWKHAFVKGAQSLMENWEQDKDTGAWLWRSQVFGFERHYYGACHGVAGNVNILLQGQDLLPEIDADIMIERAVSTLDIAAKKETNTFNWPLSTKPDVNKLLLQWCHGAAGIITAMARTPKTGSFHSVRLEDLLSGAAELLWQAGPLKKGSNVCHGTAGNGYAFLYLYKRSGEEIWLERARQFAVHALMQCQKDRAHYGQGRYTLWTGDGGLAIFLHHCLHPEEAAIPGLDLF